MADIRLSWVEVDTDCGPVDVRLSFFEFDSAPALADVRLSWLEFDADSALAVAETPKAAIVGRGPGTTINFSDYMAQLKRGHALPSAPAVVAAPSRRRVLKKCQRMEEEVLLLLQDF